MYFSLKMYVPSIFFEYFIDLGLPLLNLSLSLFPLLPFSLAPPSSAHLSSPTSPFFLSLSIEFQFVAYIS